jgi:hypothetical protein
MFSALNKCHDLASSSYGGTLQALLVGAQAQIEEIMSLQSACVVATMPEDWPAREHERQNALRYYDLAKRLDQTFPAPNFTHGIARQ